MKARRLLSLGIVCTLLATLSVAAGAATQANPCTEGAAYDPACDVDHDGDVDIYDIQLTAGHWGQTGTYFTYPIMLPKTGQTATYWPGDDGDIEKGVPWPLPRFTDNGNGTVTDNLTGLIWLKNADCSRLLSDWYAAFDFITELNTTGQMDRWPCGDTSNGGSHQNDWRMPNVRELQSLVHYGVFEPAVPNTAGTGQWTVGDPFTRLQLYRYWSSTSYPNPALPHIWTVDMYSGFANINPKTSSQYVWPVRGG